VRAPIHWGTSGDLTAAGGLGDASVDRDHVEFQADNTVVGIQLAFLELCEDAEPLVAAVADRGNRAGRVRDRLVGAAEAWDLNEPVEHDAVGYPLPVAAQRVGRVNGGPLGQ
jgi:hypothetical protein